MDLSQLEEFLAPVVAARAADYLHEFGEAWAVAAADAAPARTGRLKRSVRWVSTGPTAGYLEVIFYGRFVQRGHQVTAWGRRTSRHVPANPFLSRGATQAYSPLPAADLQTLREAALAAIAALA